MDKQIMRMCKVNYTNSTTLSDNAVVTLQHAAALYRQVVVPTFQKGRIALFPRILTREHFNSEKQIAYSYSRHIRVIYRV